MFYETAGQKGGHIMQATKIEWCNSTWNPVTGCLQGCHYCYAKRIAERFGGCDHPTTDRELSCPLTITRQNGKAMLDGGPVWAMAPDTLDYGSAGRLYGGPAAQIPVPHKESESILGTE